MERQHFMVSEQHMRWIRRMSKDKGVSMSEVLRAAIDAYFAGKEGK